MVVETSRLGSEREGEAADSEAAAELLREHILVEVTVEENIFRCGVENLRAEGGREEAIGGQQGNYSSSSFTVLFATPIFTVHLETFSIRSVFIYANGFTYLKKGTLDELIFLHVIIKEKVGNEPEEKLLIFKKSRDGKKQKIATLSPAKLISVEDVQILSQPLSIIMKYKSKEMLSNEKKLSLDECFKKFTHKYDTIFYFRNIIISRASIDEIILDKYLDNNHVDVFALLLHEKNKLSPHKYHNFLYVSPIYWNYKQIDPIATLYIEHITNIIVKSCNLLLQPIINDGHWTLLVQPIRGVLIQTNIIDCGMFICKYIEKFVLENKINLVKSKNWQ
ncbi:hypothetical protein IEQ34_023031 [Dendrobium chrysotoxum]|uniref:Ubiquitin-like protease family profile domain-containing protein n=1 Tax=Dendrobium chrysotoxum TaxID=161865 RepID=A0AAV7FZ52_DENCH|nr:hypothetical protein IEQ34_023031 [Dendrobium chrysotoxum]